MKKRLSVVLFSFLVCPNPASAQLGGLLVSITAPTPGSTVVGTVTVRASVTLGGPLTAGVQFKLDGVNLGPEDTQAPYEIPWDTLLASNGSHTLRAEARSLLGLKFPSNPVAVNVSNAPAPSDAGDVFVALLNGNVQWHSPDGTLKRTLSGVSDGETSGIAFDAAKNLYVPHWESTTPLAPGNSMARFDDEGNLLGTFGSYNCNPSSVAFDSAGNVYVGQADCSGDILKFDPAGNQLASFDAAVGVRGADHIDLAPDGCTMFYSNWTHDVLRFDVCTNQQLPNFNTAPLPGETAFHLRILPDGGVLVADCQWIVRLDAAGNQIQTYSVPNESNWWTGLALAANGSFWANNATNANIYKFDIATGAVQAMFNAGSGDWTAIGVAVKP